LHSFLRPRGVNIQEKPNLDFAAMIFVVDLWFGISKEWCHSTMLRSNIVDVWDGSNYIEHDAWSSCIDWFRSCHPTREFIPNSKTLRFTDGCIPCFPGPGSGLRWLSLVSWLPVTYGRQLSHETKKTTWSRTKSMSHPGWLLGILILAFKKIPM